MLVAPDRSYLRKFNFTSNVFEWSTIINRGGNWKAAKKGYESWKLVLELHNTTSISTAKKPAPVPSNMFLTPAGHFRTLSTSKILPSTSGFLRVEIKTGRNLAPFDSNGLSDPFCKLTLHNSVSTQVFHTEVVQKSLNPHWNKEFVFQIQSQDDPDETEVVIEVLDKALVENNVMGEVRYPIAAFIAVKSIQEWYPVQQPPNYKGTNTTFGQIEIGFDYFSSSDVGTHVKVVESE